MRTTCTKARDDRGSNSSWLGCIAALIHLEVHFLNLTLKVGRVARVGPQIQGSENRGEKEPAAENQDRLVLFASPPHIAVIPAIGGWGCHGRRRCQRGGGSRRLGVLAVRMGAFSDGSWPSDGADKEWIAVG